MVDTTKPKPIVYAYLHGFLSDENSFKGRYFRQYFQESGFDEELHLLNLNGPNSYAGITYSGALAVLEKFHQEQETKKGEEVVLNLIGSSLGGYIASRYAELHPKKVGRLVLLCPGYDLHSRWPKIYGEEGLRQWRTTGKRTFEAKGNPVEIPYSFVEDGQSLPPYPQYQCPTLLIHGLQDEVVPVETSITATLEKSETIKDLTTLMLVDDDHGLTKKDTLKFASSSITAFFDLHPSNSRGRQEASSSAAMEKQHMIEVEEKFPLKDRKALEEGIAKLDGKLKAKMVFTDIYYDLPSGAFRAANVWLRQRGGIYELKIPVPTTSSSSSACKACVYREVNGDDEIIKWLIKTFPTELGAYAPSHYDDVSSLLKAVKAKELAKYSTHYRSKYKIGDDLTIDVDEASYGYSIVELEMLVASPEEIGEAKERITRLAKDLGLDVGHSSSNVATRGKLDEYLARFVDR